MAKNETRYRNAMRMIRAGMDFKTITSLTGFSEAVLHAMSIDMERNNDND